MLKTRLPALVLCLSLMLSVTADAAVQPEPSLPPEPYVQGTGDGRFLPYRPLTHHEAAIMVSNLFGGDNLPVSDTTEDPITRAEFLHLLSSFFPAEEGDASFSDLPTDHWAYDIIRSAVAKGWLKGYGDGTIRPDSTITRAEAVTVLNAALGRKVETDVLTLIQNTTLWTYADVMPEDWFFGQVMAASAPVEGKGTYTSGDPALDALVTDLINRCTTPEMTREEKLHACFVTLRDQYKYLGRAHQQRGSVSWYQESATFMLTNKKGNCYCYAASFLYAARHLGYLAYGISGGVGGEDLDHAWVMIGDRLYDVGNFNVFGKLPAESGYYYRFP